jgi:hypothetical protein
MRKSNFIIDRQALKIAEAIVELKAFVGDSTNQLLPSHRQAMKELHEQLNQHLSAFWSEPSDETFQTFKTQCEHTIATAETRFNKDPSVWRHYIMPLANMILNALNIIASYCGVPAKRQFGLFETQTKASIEASIEWNTIKPGVLAVLTNEELKQAIHEHTLKRE